MRIYSVTGKSQDVTVRVRCFYHQQPKKKEGKGGCNLKQFIAAIGSNYLPQESTPWGTKDFYVEDPYGYIICFGGHPTEG
jgi:hypothetical protein